MAATSVALLPFALLLLFGSGVGLPVCLPPGDPDPALDKMAPDECLLFTCWSGWQAADPSSGNATERLLAEPEIHQLLTQADQELRRWLLQMAESDRDAAVAARIMPPVVKVLLTRPLAMYVSQLELARNAPPQVRGAVVANLGPVRGEIENLLKQIPDEEVEAVTIDGAPFRRWRLDVDQAAPHVTFGIHGDYFIAAVGDGEVEALLKRQATPPPGWLVQLRERYRNEVDRVATVSYVDLAGGLEALRPLTGGEGLQVLNQLGLGNLDRFESVAGLDKQGYVGLAALDLRGPPQGLVRALAGEPLQASDLAVIPPDPYLALAVRMDVKKLFDEMLEIAGTVDPRAANDLQSGIGALEQMIGMRVREEFLQSLGDVWTLHASPEDGGLLTGWTATVPVRDKGKVTLALALARTRLVAATQGRGRRGAVKVVWNRFADEDIYHFSVADGIPFAPAYCVTDSHLVVGLFPQAVKSFLLRSGDKKTLASAPKVAAQLARKPGPLTLAYVDNKELLQLAYPFVQMGLRMVNGDLARDEAPLDYFKLPSLTSMSRHLGAGVSVTRKTDHGFEFEQRQTLPGGSIGAVAPIGLALALPAIAEARRNASNNNLRQIGIAAHNFHDTYKTFPPRFHTDRGGKPLLSWRVHLLPFLDQVQLYNQFRLDEPWDSEHNKQLIAHMPAAYRSPVSKAPPGQTTYVVPAGKQSVFQAPRPTENGTRVPTSSRIANVRDGTSNTIMVVEVPDAQAAIWSKPADYEYSTDDPGKGLFGAYPGGFNALFTDGSVQFLPDDLSKQTLNGLFTRDGGEVVEFRRR